MKKSSYYNLLTGRLSQLLLLLLMAIVLQTCAVNPVTGKKEFSLMSEQQEIAMGQQSDPSIVAQFGVYNDPALQKFVSEKGLAMAKISERPNLPWEFKIMDSPVVNAFAVPGGYVYFTRGILAHFNNEAQFAGVLGHEIGHVTARHSVQQQSKATLAQLGLIAGMIAVPQIAQMGQEAMQGLQLLLLKFGRDAESQSDALGVKYSSQIGYDAREMAGFFSTLDRLSGGSENRLPSFLSTHPDPVNRFQNVLSMAEEVQKANPSVEFDVNRNSYLRMIDGILYGEDPRQGYVDNNTFYHPELKFQYPVPQGWQLANSPSQVQMAPQDGKALMMLRLAPGNSLEEAAQGILEQNKLQLVASEKGNVNGLPALQMTADLTQQTQQGNQVLRTFSTLIQYGGNIYHLMGLAALNDFNNYLRTFDYTMSNFRQLTDQSKINKQPERIKVITNDRAGTLQSIFERNKLPQDRWQEFAVLNGLELTTQIPANVMIKLVTDSKR